jgi:hypothetical protein
MSEEHKPVPDGVDRSGHHAVPTGKWPTSKAAASPWIEPSIRYTPCYVVASRSKADETILNAAADPAICVISNESVRRIPRQDAGPHAVITDLQASGRTRRHERARGHGRLSTNRHHGSTVIALRDVSGCLEQSDALGLTSRRDAWGAVAAFSGSTGWARTDVRRA